MVKILEQSVQFKWATPNIGEEIESATRTCYKSEEYIKEGSAERLYNQVVKQKHHDSVSEHGVISMHIVTDRATMSQVTRHRLFSFSVESQRYCNYSKDKFGSEIQVILPSGLSPVENHIAYGIWLESMYNAEHSYFELINQKVKPESARMVLPNSTKTEFRITGNVRVWRNFLSLRLSSHAQADVRQLAQMLYDEMIENGIPKYLFDDIVN